MSLAKKYQISGEPEPLSLIVMYTPLNVVVSEEELYLRGRAIELCQGYAGNTSTVEAIKEIGEQLMLEGLGNVEIIDDTVQMLEEQNFGAVLSSADQSLIIAYHNLIRKTADKGCVCHSTPKCWSLCRHSILTPYT